MSEVAEAGDLQELKQLRGHLDVLQWARANGCPWNKRERYFAAGGTNRGTKITKPWIGAQPE